MSDPYLGNVIFSTFYNETRNQFLIDNLKVVKSPDEDAKVSPEVNVIKEDKHIKYFKLPEDNGWNNGRALLISQGISSALSVHFLQMTSI